MSRGRNTEIEEGLRAWVKGQEKGRGIGMGLVVPE